MKTMGQKCLFLIVLYVSSYRWVHFSRAVLLRQPRQQLFTHCLYCCFDYVFICLQYFDSVAKWNFYCCYVQVPEHEDQRRWCPSYHLPWLWLLHAGPCGDHWECGVPWHGTQISAVWHQGKKNNFWLMNCYYIQICCPFISGKGPFNCTFRIIRQVITDRCMLHIECECITESPQEQLFLCVKESMLRFVLIDSVLLNLSCVWIPSRTSAFRWKKGYTKSV